MELVSVVRMPGDGIGPEVMHAACRVIEASGVKIHWIDAMLGKAAYDETGDTLPRATLEALRTHRVGLKGPTTTVQGGGLVSANVRMRMELGLYAGVRPAVAFEGIELARQGTHIIVFREGTEGFYAGIEDERVDGSILSSGVFTYDAMAQLARRAFGYARKHGHTRVIHAGKSNIIKRAFGTYERAFLAVAQDFPDIKAECMNIDALLALLVLKPQTVQVLVMENLFGDITSELCAGLVGGVGLVAGANYGDGGRAVFEAVHGTAPDIAGRGIANPTALILSGVMLLEHIGAVVEAQHVREALARTFRMGIGTGDLAVMKRTVNTENFASAVIEQLSFI